jgi:peptidyl-prolyl cis-trans isomerase B (cyclophilin B)
MTEPSAPAPYSPSPQVSAGPGGAAFTPGPPTNALAIVALVLSLVGVSIGGIICGHIALSQIGRTGESGRGLALAGVIIGYVITGFVVLVILGYLLVLIFAVGLGLGVTSYRGE